MKKIITIISLLFFITAIAQKQRVVLVFKDGTMTTGLGKIVGNKIKFKKGKGKKKYTYSHKEVNSLVTGEGNTNIEYFYKFIEGKKKVVLLELVKKGKVKLYKSISTYVPSSFGPNGVFIEGRHKGSSSYYVSKSNNEKVFDLGDGTPFTKNFKKAASNYFKDCSILTNMIQDKKYKIKDIKEIVKFYNDGCKW